MKPNIGEPAPDFEVTAIGGKYSQETQVKLTDFAGQKVVLFFYPKDLTPGWNNQACAIRDQWGELKDKAKIFGVSPDSIESHKKFISKKSLPFSLISDPDRNLIGPYGVAGEKSVLGKALFSITERSTFIIDEDGKISHILEKVSPTKHLDDLLDALE